MSTPSCLSVNLTIVNQANRSSEDMPSSARQQRSGERQRKYEGTTSPRHIRFGATSRRPPALNTLREPSGRRPIHLYVLDFGSEDDDEEEIDLREALFTQSPPWTNRRETAGQTSDNALALCRPPATPSTASTTRTLASSFMTMSTMATSIFSSTSEAVPETTQKDADKENAATDSQTNQGAPLHSARIHRSSGCLNLLALNQQHVLASNRQ